MHHSYGASRSLSDIQATKYDAKSNSKQFVLQMSSTSTLAFSRNFLFLIRFAFRWVFVTMTRLLSAEVMQRYDKVRSPGHHQQPVVEPLQHGEPALLQSAYCHDNLGLIPMEIVDVRAKVSSIFTISLALVSMKPHLRRRAHSKPSFALICRCPCKSHLFPATIFTGGVFPLSIRFSSSMSIISMKYSSASSEFGDVMS